MGTHPDTQCRQEDIWHIRALIQVSRLQRFSDTVQSIQANPDQDIHFLQPDTTHKIGNLIV